VRTRNILASAVLVLSSTGALGTGAIAQTSAAPASFSGHWEKKKDPFCQMTLVQKGNKLTGTYSTAPHPDAKKVQDGQIEGNITKPGHARVSYTSSWANEGARGKLDLDLTGKGLKWTLVEAPTQDYGEDYSPNSVLMTKK
jgi:hypothetical protein